MAKRRQRKHSGAFKAKVALVEDKTINELAN
jgi:hypothetical protein